MSPLEQAISRAKAFASTWADDDVIDEESRLSVADLLALIAAAEASTPVPRLD